MKIDKFVAFSGASINMFAYPADLGVYQGKLVTTIKITRCRESFHRHLVLHDNECRKALFFRGELEPVKRLLDVIETHLHIPEEKRSKFTVAEKSEAAHKSYGNTWLLVEHPWWTEQPLILHSLFTIFLRCGRSGIASIGDLTMHHYMSLTKPALDYFLAGHTFVSHAINRSGMWVTHMAGTDKYKHLLRPEDIHGSRKSA